MHYALPLPYLRFLRRIYRLCAFAFTPRATPSAVTLLVVYSFDYSTIATVELNSITVRALCAFRDGPRGTFTFPRWLRYAAFPLMDPIPSASLAAAVTIYSVSL